MLSQEKTAEQDTDWKKQYIQTLNELDAKEKDWEKQQQALLKTVLKLTFTFQGANDLLDKNLLDLKAALKKSTETIPQKEIDQLVQSILKHKKDRDADTSRTNLLVSNILQLLSNEHQSGQFVEKFRTINNDIQNNAANPLSKLKPLNESITGLNKFLAKEKQKPDSFKVFLKKLSEHKDTEPLLAELCKKSIAVKTEQEKLRAINQCIEKINQQTETDNTGNNQKNVEHHVEKLVTLLDWVTIPGKSQSKLDTLKQQLEQRKDNNDLGNLIRRIALTISNAFMEQQSELNETEGFLKKVTHQLNEITLQIADIETLENESFTDSVSLNTEMGKQIDLIRNGIDDSKNNMDQFISVEQQRKTHSESRHQELVERINTMEVETEKLRQCIEEEKNKAYNDALTGIPNRMAFDERINQEYKRWQRYDNKLSLCLVDIDKFKNVNDTYGHKAGDIVLRTVAEKCVAKVRKSDFFCRYGGEEFALILPETNLSAAITVAETLRQNIEACSFQYGDQNVPITISCGLAEFKGKDNLDSIFKRADKALYKAKETGRNRCISEEQLHLI